ncbi:MAG: hypothetical protein WCR51_04695 [Planctomycetia bacterium]
MTPNLEKTDEAFGSGMTASFLGTVRDAVFATAVALPLGMLLAMDSFEGESEAASAGELWLEVQSRLTVAAERMT